MRPGGDCGGQAGVTLVEIAVVLGVLGLLAFMARPSLQRWKEVSDLRAAASRVSETMLSARMKSIAERRNYTVSVDYAADTCRVEPSGETVRREGSADLYADTSDPDCPPLSAQDVVFRPNGTADAVGFEAVYLKSRSPRVTTRYRVKVLGATGKIGVERRLGGGWVSAY